LIDDIQECLVKIGKAGKMSVRQRAGSKFTIEGREVTRRFDTYSVWQNKTKRNGVVLKKEVKKVYYKGYVYCVSTPYKTIMVRRNGCCMWSGNSDFNEFLSIKGGEVVRVHSESNMPPSAQAHFAVEMCKEVNGNFIIVDCDGIGIGAYQELNRFSEKYLDGIQIIKFHGSAPSEKLEAGRRIYQNMRAEAAFTTQSRARKGLAAINEDHKEMIEDLTEEEYFTNNKGLIQIEAKEDIKERLGRSPGKGDAYKMAQFACDMEVKNVVYDNEFLTRIVPEETLI